MPERERRRRRRRKFSPASLETPQDIYPPHTHISLYTGISFFDPFLALRNKEFLRPME
jgi:hypothetical protein